MEQTEKVIASCAGAAAGLCFLPWFSVSMSGEVREMSELLGQASSNAFGATEGVFAFLACAGTAGLVILDDAGLLPWQKKARLFAPLATAGVGVIFFLIYMTRGGSFNMGGMSAGRTVWFYLALILIGVAGFNAFSRWQQGIAAAEDDSATGESDQP